MSNLNHPLMCVCAQLCLTLCNPMDCSLWAPLSMEFSRQEYWSGLTFPPPGDCPHPGIEPTSLCLLCWHADILPLVPPGKQLPSKEESNVNFL